MTCDSIWLQAAPPENPTALTPSTEALSTAKEAKPFAK
jgi:hypothetical protein